MSEEVQVPVTEPVKPTPEELRKEWEDICAKSNGSRVLLSGDMEVKAKEFQAKFKAFQEAAVEYAKLAMHYEHEKEAYFYGVRLDLHANGIMEAPWEADIGFEEQAKKDGVLVLNIKN